MAREYSFYLRVAYVCTAKCPVEYYSAPEDIWTPPEPGSPYTADDVAKLVVKGTGLEFPYPDVTAPGRDTVPPATQASVEQRQTIAAVQEAQTMESLRQVGVALPNPPEIGIIVAPSGESQSAETAQIGPELPTGAGAVAHGSAQEPLLTRPPQAEMAAELKERVDFDKNAEPSMWTTALLTATAQWLHSPVGSGVTRGEASKPEELGSMSSGIGFDMLAQGMARNVG